MSDENARAVLWLMLTASAHGWGRQSVESLARHRTNRELADLSATQLAALNAELPVLSHGTGRVCNRSCFAGGCMCPRCAPKQKKGAGDDRMHRKPER